MITGFTIGPGPSKTVLVRAVGPTLGSFGLDGTLPDPKLEIYSGATKVAENDNWNSADASTFSSVGAFALGANSRDAAIVTTLAPGSYTAQVSGVGGLAGVVLVEVYEVNGGATRLINLSTRAQVGTGGDILIPGITISPGSGSRRLLIRAVGPTLGSFGVDGTIPDPKVELYSGANKIAENDNWGTPVGMGAADATALNAAFTQAGAFALANGSRDAALLSSLSAGSYTLQVSGVGNTTGVALVEVYDLSPSMPAPVITAQPQAAAFTLGGSGTLSVSAEGTGLAYQWTKDGAAIPDATGATLTLPSVSAADAGSYSVVVTNGGGTATSAAAAVTVKPNQTGAKPGAALYIARLRPDAAADASTASGYATVRINSDGTALVSVTFSNLSSQETSAHLKLGATGEFVLGLPAGQVTDAFWRFQPSGAATTNDLINALNTGNIFVSLDSAKYPGGELRGNFVSATGSQTFTPPAAPPPLAADALTKPSQTDAARFLTQATFGPTSAEIEKVMQQGITKWIDEQMALPMTSHLAGLRADVAEFPNPPVPPNVLGTSYHWADRNNRVASWWKIAVTSPDQLRQRVAFALSEIFVVSDLDSTLAVKQEGNTKYYDILARQAFGSFRQLLDEVTLSPIMGWWLSHIRNQKANPAKGTSPDENYAREVQQLFTVGLVQLQPDGTLLLDASGQPIPTYNQEMVSETAKVFTGWGFANVARFTDAPPFMEGDTTGSMPENNGWLLPMAYYDAFHDKTEKRVLSLQQVPLDQAKPTVIPANQTGPQDLKMMLDALFNHPNTAPFICRQLIQRLVTSNPSPGYVYRVARVFADDGTGSRGNLGAVVKAILTDYEARSPEVLANIGYGKIKEPLLRATQFFRLLKAAAPNGRFMDSYFTTPQSDGYHPGGAIIGGVSGSFNQGPLSAPTVFNFFSPDYAPPGALAAAGLVAPEMEITDASFAIRVPNTLLTYLYRSAPPVASPPAPSPSPYLVLDFSEFTPLANDPPALLDKLSLLFCANQMSATTRAHITTALARYTGLSRVQTAIHLTLFSQDCALQR